MQDVLTFSGVEIHEKAGEHFFSLKGEQRVVIGAPIVVNGLRGHITRHIYDRTTVDRTTTIFFSV